VPTGEDAESEVLEQELRKREEQRRVEVEELGAAGYCKWFSRVV